jgi:hypothetical protein
MLYPGIGCIPFKIPRVFFASQYGGLMLVNRVRAGRTLFSPSKLRSIGAATHTPRHAPALVPAKWRMAAIWTAGGNIVAVDVEGALAGACKPTVLCAGQKAADCAMGAGIGLAVLRGGSVLFATVETRKQ